MAISKRGQGSLNSRQKTAKSKRNWSKTNLTSILSKTERINEQKRAEVRENAKRLRWVWYALLAAAASSCYWQTLFGELVHDDIFAVKYNADIRPETPILSLFSHDYWGKPLNSPSSHKSFRPVSVLSFRLQFLFHGLQPFGYRLVNVILHVVVTLLFVRVCEIVLGCARLFSFVTGLLFAVHPIHSEAVNGIVGRADILSCLLFLLAFNSYANCIQCLGQKHVDSNKNNVFVPQCLQMYWTSFILCIFFGAAAMLAKENGITVFGVCMLYDLITMATQCHSLRLTDVKSKLCEMDARLLKRMIVLTFVTVALICFRMLLQNGELPHFSADENPASHSDSWLTRFLTYAYLCVFNALLLLSPVTLCYDWHMGSIPLVESLLDVRNMATAVFFFILFSLFVISFFTFIFNKYERRILLTGLVFLIVPFLPASNILFPVGFVIAERILYTPSLGYCILLNFGFAKFAGVSVCADDEKPVLWGKTTKFQIASFTCTVMLGLLSYKTWQQSTAWQTRETLYRAGVKALPQNAKVHYNYANYLSDVKRKDEAIHHYQKALQLAPHHASSHNNLGILLANSEEAMEHFKLAIQYNPNHANAYLNLGTLLSARNELDKSEKYLRQSHRINPQSGKTLAILADVMNKKGRVAEAEKLYKESIIKAPADAVLYDNYGKFLAKNERIGEALSHYHKATDLAPKTSVFLMNKVHVLMSVGKFQEAEHSLKRFLEEKEDATVLHQLGVLYYKLNRFSDAEIAWQEAIKIDPTSKITMFNYGILLKEQGRTEEAFRVLDQCLKINPQSSEMSKDVIGVMHEMGHSTEALQAVDKVLKVFKQAVFYYQKGNILKDLRLHQEAIESYQMAINLDPNYTDVYLNLGAIHHLMKNFDEAEKYYTRALKLDPLNQQVKRNLDKLRNK